MNMKRYLIVLSLIVTLLTPAPVWPICCATITDGPTAWAPQFSATGCGQAMRKGFWGGSFSVTTDGAAPDVGGATQTAKLMQHVIGANDVVFASAGNNVAPQCGGAVTVIAGWRNTPTCSVPTGRDYFTQYYAGVAACSTAPSSTTMVTSGIVPCN
jgi:hypothetical protein